MTGSRSPRTHGPHDFTFQGLQDPSVGRLDLEALRAHPGDLAAGVAAAVHAAAEGREATKPMVATKGRASYLGERSVGHIDPGAASTALILAALDDVVAGRTV